MEKVENLDILRQYCDSIGHFVLSDDMLQEIMAEFEVNSLGVSDAEFFIMYRMGIESVVKGWSDYGNIKIASHKQSDSYTYSVYGTFTAYDKFGSPSPMKFELYYYAEYSSEESCGYTISQSLIVRK